VPPSRSRVDGTSEEAALACLHRGQRDEALRILMTAYGAPLTAFILRIVRDRDLAKDVRQEVFLCAFRRFDTFQGRGSLWGWLCGIAFHRCLDELKHIKHRGVVDNFEVLDNLVGPSEIGMDPDRIAKQRALEHCLGKLSEPMRAQVLMRCFLGLSYEEIGKLVGDSLGTVQVRISRILPRLRRCLRNEGVGR
jgi:RNA polymerase sigma-70 factor (ECF subfamily)